MPSFSPVMEVAFPPGKVPFVTRNLVLNLQRLRFEDAGVYRFEVTINGVPLAMVPLRVTRIEEMRGAAGPAG
jgi:hypothetical protein